MQGDGYNRARAPDGCWLAVIACAATALGCGSQGAKSCQVDADCGSGATCQSGACQTGLRLALTSPDNGAATSGVLPVQVEARGGAPGEIELMVDELPLIKVGPPYEYAWDTTSTVEGAHRLWARVIAGGRVYESARVDVTVDRTAPPVPTVNVTAPTSTSPVLVSGGAEPGALVTVSEGTVPLGQAVVGAGGAWTASLGPLAEGVHPLIATASDAAGNESGPSAAASLTVDRTPPQVARTAGGELVAVPRPGATNVWSRDPITVTFSEAMSAASVVDGSVLLAGAGSSVLSKELILSADGRVLTVRPSSLPPVPNTLTVTLTGRLTDLAGNGLVAPPSWSWELPEWQDLGRVARHGSGYGPTLMALDGDSPVIVHANGEPGAVPIDAAEWDGEQWADPGLGNRATDRDVSLDVDEQGRVVVAWASAANPSQVLVARRDAAGSAWSTSASLNRVSAQSASDPSVRLDRDGNVHVAWLELAGDPAVARVFATSWDGTTATALGTAALNAAATSSAAVPVMSLDASGSPRVTWREADRLVSRTWTGGAWGGGGDFLFPGGVTSASIGAALMDTTGTHPVIGSRDAATSTARLWRHSCSGSCIPGVSHFGALGSAFSVNSPGSAWSFSAALDASELPVVAWAEGSAIYAQRWDGSEWRRLGGNVASVPAPYGPVVAVGPSGIVAVAYCYAPPVQLWELYAKRYNYNW